VRTADPDVLIIAGDVVVDGLVERQWRETFLTPAGDLLARTPTAVVPGNHDRYSPLMEKLLGYGSDGPHWSLSLGGGLLVGIDGGEDFGAESSSTRWLDRTLKGRRETLAFVVSHYPAYSSRNHGKLAPDGRVLEWTSRLARNRIAGLLEKRGVAALFGGHDHGYERSELPGGLSAVVTGGGGAGPYPKRDDAAEQNPHSKAFAVKHHYSLLRIGPNEATLRVSTPEGALIDERTWSAEAQQEN
jgi:3',5'-cyclic AMP phosphodiesterase CpdA